MKRVRSEARGLHPARGVAPPGMRSLEGTSSGVPIVRARAQRFARPLVYFRFTPDEFILSVAGSDERYGSTPHVAVEPRTRLVKAVGPEAPRFASQDVVVENGFRASGGSILGDVDLAEIAFRYAFEGFIGRVRRGQLPLLRWMKPDLLIHPLHVQPGQLTQLEMRALYQFGERCGARNTEVYVGPELGDLLLRTGWYVAVD